MAGVSAIFAFFAVMSVIDLLKTDRDAQEELRGLMKGPRRASRSLRYVGN
jgi:hypothetical protein